MTSRERLLKTLNGQNTDRVPVTLFIADQGHFISQLHPDIDPFDYEQLQFRVVDYQRSLGLDVFIRQLFGLNDPLSIHMGGLNVSLQNDNWQVETTLSKNGNTKKEYSRITTPDGVLTQEMSTNEIRPGTFLYACTEKPIKNENDLELAMAYEPPMPADWPQKAKLKVQKLKDYVGDDGIVGSWTPHGPFNNASILIDHQEIYSLFLTDPGYYDKLMKFASARIKDYTAAIDAAGVDVHCVGGNVPGGFLGKRIYDEYILPYERDYIRFVQKNGTPAIYHNCGEIMNLVESYKELGVRVVEPFSPPPLGDADLARAVEIVNGDYVMIGGVDQVNVLQNGDTELVKKVTKQTMLTGKQGGKFILQSADFLEYGTPFENLEVYASTALANSAY
ncbi:MAG: uroporphyrinogen decarboxylase family protein [Sedimentisphaeraceae bacterium JB056]